MRFQKGECGNPQGRPRGRLNKVNRELREMILTALSEAGGVEYLTRQATENPPAFLALLGKLLPRDVQIEQTARAYVVAPEVAATMEEWTQQVKVH